MSETKEIDDVVKLVVDIAKAARGALSNGANLTADLALIMPLLQDVPAALEGSGLIVDEFKTLDPAGLAKLEADALQLLGASTGAELSARMVIDVQEAINILISLYKIAKA